MLPVRFTDATGPTRSAVQRPAGNPVAAVDGDRRVLIVDDYPDSAASAAMLISMYGYECRTACNGRDALEAASAFDPDIVLLDIGLPDISGYDVARTLRDRQARPLFLAAVTGWGQPQDRVRAFASGFDLHVLKPTNAATIRLILQRAIAYFDGG
jgi:CheY-like chemotaxis protein